MPGAPETAEAGLDAFGGRARISPLLAPLEALYATAVRLRAAAYERGWIAVRRASIPVVSVGNLTVGGTGKTPFVRWLVDRLVAQGRRPAIIHSGYADDEPALHRRWHPGLPVLGRRDRYGAVRDAEAADADLAVLDDGFQHRRLARGLDLVLVSADAWSNTRRLLPRGPWREPITALGRADAVVITRKAVARERARTVHDAIRALLPALPVVRCELRPSGWIGAAGAPRTGEPAGIAVAGLASPEPFFANARAAGARIEDRLVFPDHHPYPARDVARIADRAAGRAVITTEKDAIKLEGEARDLDLWILEQELRIEEGAELLDRLLRAVAA